MIAYIVYTMHQLLLAACVSLTSSAFTVSTSPFIPVPCHVTKDSTYHSVSVNCTHRGITSLPLPEQWLPPSVTSLFLDYNSIAELNNKSFSFIAASYATLRYLSLSNNMIDFIAPSVFSVLVSLESLDLNSNKINLDRGTINGRSFHGLGNLLRLDVRNNDMQYKRGIYPDGLFRDLRNLISLSLETFYGDLNFVSLFNTTKRLSSLLLSGGMLRITNNSFESFSDIHLKEFLIDSATYLHTTDTDAFRYFTFLDSYTHYRGTQPISVILESFAPFSGRNMSRIRIGHLNDNDFNVPNIFLHNTVITKYMARYLSQICIEDFSLTKSDIFLIDMELFKNRVWSSCLKNLDLSNNPFVTRAEYEISEFTNLERLVSTGRKYYLSHHKTNPTWRPISCVSTVQSSSSYLKQGADEDAKNNDSQLKGNMIHLSKSTDQSGLNHSHVSKSVRNQRPETYRHLADECQQFRDQRNVSVVSTLNIYIPKLLEIVNMNSEADALSNFHQNFQLHGGDNLKELHLADNGIYHFNGSICGLSNLELLDISRNDGSVMSHTFFNCMPTLLYLNMADMSLDSIFMASYSSQLFKCLTELTTLDISSNGLHYLTAASFVINNKLSVLSLADNRFQEIPFNLQDTPRLCYLDMSKNSLRTISEKDIASLERHADTVHIFSLKLDGNAFYCGCKSIKFLSWLQITQIDLDNNRNYSCISDSGTGQSTGQIKDLEAMWRLCHGENAFWISLILSLLLVLGFVCSVMIPKLQTQLVAFLLKTFRVQFMMKTSVDYPIGVYIGYADQDMELACQRLRHFVEEKLHLSTYVRHRDLLPASDIAESIIENVHASWRLLLVVSKHFLNDPWSYFLLKASPYAVHVDNPGLIVLVVIDDDNDEPIWSRFPNGFLQTVLEENIITMTSDGNMSYEDKQALETALLK